jgi:UDP-N-acetylmuramate dehydrogenase
MAKVNEIKEALGDITTGKVLFDEPMSRHSSLAVGGNAGALAFVEDEEELVHIVQRLKERKINYIVVGNLTNIIVRDGGYRGVILMMKGLKELRCKCTPEGDYSILAQSGVALSKVVSMAERNELTGVEFCAGIPGSVGGAVWMNAGAYGKEMKDIIQTVSLLNGAGEMKTIRRDDIPFSYRKSGLPDDAIILDAEFKLEKGDAEKIKSKISEIIKWRQEKHPLNFPNAGSIFKNQPGQPAGVVIEEIGLKGISCNDAEVSMKHANFIINKGKATASDVLKLIAIIQAKAIKEKGLNLETEVVIIGED